MGPAIEEWISDDNQRIDPRVHEGSKGYVDLRFGAGVLSAPTGDGEAMTPPFPWPGAGSRKRAECAVRSILLVEFTKLLRMVVAERDLCARMVELRIFSIYSH